MAYDNQTRSMLQTGQPRPDVGSQSGTVQANPDGSTDIYFGPSPPDGAPETNWLQTVPDKGFFTILRLYSPLQPFFDKTWRPSEIEPNCQLTAKPHNGHYRQAPPSAEGWLARGDRWR